MSLTAVGIIGICIFAILLFLNVPVGFTMLLVGLAGTIVIRGLDAGLSSMAVVAVRQSQTYLMASVPLFVLMGYLACETGLTDDGFYTTNKWVGHWRGGLAISAIIASAAFGAVCASVVAAAAAMSSVAVPEMRKYKYSDELSLGCIAGGANLSFLIPPSLGFITYGLLTELSIGTLFFAGLVPGILLTVLYVITIIVECRLNPSLATVAPKVSWRERIVSLKKVWAFALLILLVLGGMYGGVFSSTEAGGIGALGVLVLGLVNRRVSRSILAKSLSATAILTGMVFILLIGSKVFSTFITSTEIPLLLTTAVSEMQVPAVLILWVILVCYVIIGCFVDIMAVIILVCPIISPILVALGFDPIWIAVLTVITVVMGHISPPFGLVVFTLAGVVKDAPLWTIFRGALPFLGAMFVCLMLVFVFPQIALWLPYYMK